MYDYSLAFVCTVRLAFYSDMAKNGELFTRVHSAAAAGSIAWDPIARSAPYPCNQEGKSLTR